MAYQAWIGFYNSNLKTTKWSKAELVNNGNRWICESCRQPNPPAIRARTVGKMGLKNVPGLNIER
jgi:ATP-dependent RNA helicase MSS116